MVWTDSGKPRFACFNRYVAASEMACSTSCLKSAAIVGKRTMVVSSSPGILLGACDSTILFLR